MKPYYQESGVTIYHADACDILPSLPKTRLVLTDPPYALNAVRGEWTATASVAIGLHEAAKRVLDGGALLTFTTSSGRGVQYTLGAVSRVLPFNRVMVWHKPFSTSKAAGPFRWDVVLVLAFGRATFGTSERSSMLSTTEPRKGREHPSQVPVDVAEWLYAPYGDLAVQESDVLQPIIDPFMGSGRLLVPAVRRGHPVIGIEIDEQHCETAARQLQRESIQRLEVA